MSNYNQNPGMIHKQYDGQKQVYSSSCGIWGSCGKPKNPSTKALKMTKSTQLTGEEVSQGRPTESHQQRPKTQGYPVKKTSSEHKSQGIIPNTAQKQKTPKTLRRIIHTIIIALEHEWQKKLRQHEHFINKMQKQRKLMTSELQQVNPSES